MGNVLATKARENVSEFYQTDDASPMKLPSTTRIINTDDRVGAASWKIIPDPVLRYEQVHFLTSRKFFAVDDSGSTTGAVLAREREFVKSLKTRHANMGDAMALWGTKCDDPTSNFAAVKWESKHGYTHPGRILLNPMTHRAIKYSDVWFLLTDGQIYDSMVHKLAELAHQKNVLDVPVVFVIVGSRGRRPNSTNISVGISFFAESQNTLILFKEVETGRLYIIAGKGHFAALAGPPTATGLDSWRNLPTFANEDRFFKQCQSLCIRVPAVIYRATCPKGLSLGPEWERAHGGPVLVDADALLQAGILSDADTAQIFSGEAFNILAVAYKTRRRIPQFRAFVQKQKIEHVSLELLDVSGAAAIIRQMSDSETTKEGRVILEERLRRAHALNREHHRQAASEFASSPKAKRLKERNRLIDVALQTLAWIETASFNA
jgi:hypothetical protein